MPHTYTSCLFHAIFSTKERRRMSHPELKERLLPYIGGIARKHKMKMLAIEAVEDHLHLLLSLPAVMSIAKAIQLIKGGSSNWVHDTFPSQRGFGWQEGYAAFSIGISRVERTIAYIRNQEKHHRKKTFQEEYLLFLERHGIKYDERYLWS